MVTGSSFSPFLWHYSASLSHKGNCCQSILHDAVNDITCVSHALYTQYGIESVVCNHISHAVSSYHSHTVLIKHHISLKGMLLCLFVGFHRCNIRINIILADIIRNFRLISAAFFIKYIRRSSMQNPAHFSLNTYGVFLAICLIYYGLLFNNLRHVSHYKQGPHFRIDNSPATNVDTSKATFHLGRHIGLYALLSWHDSRSRSSNSILFDVINFIIFKPTIGAHFEQNGVFQSQTETLAITFYSSISH